MRVVCRAARRVPCALGSVVAASALAVSLVSLTVHMRQVDTEGFEPKVFEGFAKGLHGGQTEFLLFECDWAWERNGFGYSNIQATPFSL